MSLRVYEVTQPDGEGFTDQDLTQVIGELATKLASSPPGEVFTVTAREVPPALYNSLPEYEPEEIPEPGEGVEEMVRDALEGVITNDLKRKGVL